MNPWIATLTVLLGYVLGAISFTRIVGHYIAPGGDMSKADIPIRGSDKTFHLRSYGATSIRAKAGAKYGCLTSSLDMIKVTLPTLAFRLLQCLTNLLSNAVKFVPPDTKPRIRIWTELKGELVRVWVEDNGIGIAPEWQGKIFEIFQRLHSQTEYEGTGIGLAIVRKAVERMGGRVGVESEPGRGSRFWLELRSAESRA